MQSKPARIRKPLTPEEHRKQLQHAEEMAGNWLHRGNVLSERGFVAQAEQMYARAQKWHDKMNRLLGNV